MNHSLKKLRMRNIGCIYIMRRQLAKEKKYHERCLNLTKINEIYLPSSQSFVFFK